MIGMRAFGFTRHTRSIMFQVRRRPADHGQRKRKKKPLKGSGMVGTPHHSPHRHAHQPSAELFPFLIELGPDGNEMLSKGRQHQLQANVTEVGSDRIAHAGGVGGQSLHLIGPYILPRHCVIAHTDGIVTVTPCSRDAETYVNFQRIYETTILQHGAIVRFGRTNTFRFIDPQQDDRIRMHIIPQQFPPQQPSTYFDRNNYERFGPPRDPILPAVLEFREDVEDSFFHNIITQLDPTDIQFKLGPTYTLYMAARFRASTHYRADLVPTERAQKLTIMLTKVSDIIHKVIEYKHRDPTALAFWMANASELLHFLKQDRHICGYSVEAQDILAEAVQFAFKKLVDYMQLELSSAMPLFLEDRNDMGEEEGCTAHVLSILTNTMALLRRCRVNAALTIQLFSQLFHFVNMWVFNKVVLEHCPNYCTREWGERLKERLARIELWAEKQGLELAADCHLAKLSQAALLLIAPKSSSDDVAAVSSTCFKLNSLQLRELLEKYEPVAGEPPFPKDLIDNVVAVAETTADGLAREDGREIRLEEEADLELPFLLPEDGYSCDILRGVPSGLAEFLDPLQRAQLCRMTPQPTSSGFWTIYMHNYQDAVNQRPPPGPRSPSAMSNRSMSIPRGEPEVHVIELHKSNSGMGLSIVATKGENQDQLGIYIKSVVQGGAADQDGRLQAGDQLLSVDGKSLVGISQEQAAQYMVGTGTIVTLEVARQGALYHGLAPLLSQPSPQVNRVVGRRASQTENHIHSPSGPHEGYNERLVDWTRQPKQYQPPGQRPPLPLPDPSPPSSHTRSNKISSDIPHHTLSHHPNSNKFTPHPNHTMMMNSMSSPNLTGQNRLSGPPDQRRDAPLNHSNQHPNIIQHRQQQQHEMQQYRQPPYQQKQPTGYPHSQPRIQPSKSVPSLNTETVNSVNKSSSQGAFNPAYTRNNSSNPLAQHHPPLRSRSTQNLNEGGSLSLSGKHPSNPVLPTEDDRHYQNISFHQGGQDPRMGSQRGTRPVLFPHPPSVQMPEGHQRPTSAFLQREDPRNESLHRPASQQNIRQDPRLAQLSDNARRREERFNGHAYPGQASPGSIQSPLSGSMPAFQRPHQVSKPQSPYTQTYPGPHGQAPAFTTYSPNQTAPPAMRGVPPPQQMSPQYANSPQGLIGGKLPPPTAPKPNRNSGSHMEAPEKPLRQPGADTRVGGVRPPLPEEEYRDSPPPPIPPTSTHPLLQTSTGEASAVDTAKLLSVKGPWLKDEKERYENKKRELLRRRRDEHITVLEQLEVRSQQEEERLNTLRVEREFQRRAEQEDAEDAEEDDEEEIEEPNNRENMQTAPPKSWVPEEENKTNGGTPATEDRTKKADEIKRKQQELEVARVAEEKLLREAQRRQEEEQIRRQQHQRHQHHASQRLDHLVGAPGPQHSNGPTNGNNIPHVHSDRSDSSPLPPERGSSFSVMQQQSPVSPTSGGPRARATESTPVKKVQFSGMTSVGTHGFDDNANHDPNAFFNEADSMLNDNDANTNVPNTPGVIGAQEVYRDPRQRRLAEAAQKAAATLSTGPEKLTFREKMKMFAKETGDPDNTKDKTKTSKAQREIEHGS